MGIFKILKSWIKKEKAENQAASENPGAEGCPFCWGYQQYDHKVRERYKDKQIDVKNHLDKHLKSRNFQLENIDGKRYKKGEIVQCPDCGREIKK